jgi:hypothetical protein
VIGFSIRSSICSTISITIRSIIRSIICSIMRSYMGALTMTTDWAGYTLRLIETLNHLGKRTTLSATSSDTCHPTTPTPCGCPSTIERKT